MLIFLSFFINDFANEATCASFMPLDYCREFITHENNISYMVRVTIGKPSIHSTVSTTYGTKYDIAKWNVNS